MSKVITARQIDLEALPFPAQQRWDGEAGEVEADVPEADLRKAVDAAPAPTSTSADDALAGRIKAVHDDPQVSASVKKLAAALLGLDGDAAVAGRPTGR
jgi:hypothetical protein